MEKKIKSIALFLKVVHSRYTRRLLYLPIFVTFLFNQPNQTNTRPRASNSMEMQFRGLHSSASNLILWVSTLDLGQHQP